MLASTLARFADEHVAAIERALEKRTGEPWYADARAAFDAEGESAYASDEELAELALREFPLYFARYGEPEAAYLDGLLRELPNGDALRLFNEEIVKTFDLRRDLGRVTAPTLVVTGEEDFITGPVCAAEIGEELPSAPDGDRARRRPLHLRRSARAVPRRGECLPRSLM